MPVAIEQTTTSRRARPNGTRFGTLVHAILAAIELHRPDQVMALAHNQARLLGATPDEVAHAIVAVTAALAHPLLARARAATELRREVPVVVYVDDTLIEGIVDLAFLDGGVWTVVDFKTDDELGLARFVYEAQVHLYATAIGQATGAPVAAALLLL
ncbi:MAG: PD-(D/E)XK nuclease family protein [Proteobacteria bacterium]|nr:PD-(D/E)XK nuclease family protein [Pseudomonadota bacterium]